MPAAAKLVTSDALKAHIFDQWREWLHSDTPVPSSRPNSAGFGYAATEGAALFISTQPPGPPRRSAPSETEVWVLIIMTVEV